MQMWVFGYGSLLWNPGFAYVEKRLARLTGYRRSFCMRSIHHRGTPASPGLVLALDADGAAICDGLAFRIAPKNEEQVLAYLRARELISSAYYEKNVRLDLLEGGQLEALAYVINQTNEQYCRGLSLKEQARIITMARGGRGDNSEYLFKTVEQMEKLSIQDADLQWLAQDVRARLAKKDRRPLPLSAMDRPCVPSKVNHNA